MSDCSFKVGDKTFRSHKTVLGFNSPVFERMFFGELRASHETDGIVLTDIEASDFEIFLYFLYTHKTDKLKRLSIKSLRNLICLSEKYMTTKLTRCCTDVIENNLKETPKQAIGDLLNVFELGYLTCNEHLMDLSVWV